MAAPISTDIKLDITPPNVMPEELTRLLRILPLALYGVLVAISAMLFGKMLLLGYLLANGIYPYDLLAHDLTLFGIYLILAYFFAGLTLVLYGWVIGLYAAKRGKQFPLPLSVLMGVGVIGHLVVFAVTAMSIYDMNFRGIESLIQLREVLLVAAGGSKLGLSLVVAGNLFVLFALAILCGALYVGGYKGIMTGRVLPFIALFLVVGATPHGSAVVTSLVLRTWGIGGGLDVQIDRKDGRTSAGSLVLLTPETIYLNEPNEKRRVILIPRSEATRVSIEQHTWTE